MSGTPEWFLCLEAHLAAAESEVALGAVSDCRDLAAATHAAAPFAQELSDKLKGHGATKAAPPESFYPAPGRYSLGKEKAGGRQGG